MTNKKPMPDFLPCPFCGNPPKTKEWVQGHHDAMRVWCDECSVETRCQGVKSVVVEKWNTRADLAAPDHTELLKEAFHHLKFLSGYVQSSSIEETISKLTAALKQREG